MYLFQTQNSQTQQPRPSNCFTMQLPNWIYLELFRQNHGTHSQVTTFVYERQQPWTWYFPYFRFLGRKQNHFHYGHTIFIQRNPQQWRPRSTQIFLNQSPVKKPSSETLLRLAELVLTPNGFHLATATTNKSTVLQWEPKWDLATYGCQNVSIFDVAYMRLIISSYWQ